MHVHLFDAAANGERLAQAHGPVIGHLLAPVDTPRDIEVAGDQEDGAAGDCERRRYPAA
ncbi:MAG: hypothetical protein HUU14_09755 [Dehalococcoidia bacterium]|nr:hypothetical protein [Dehalococcoidia bacterium]